MDNQPLVTIIVPVFRVELFLDRCIQSVIRQTYKKWELILVDDGSPDKSGEICDTWAKRDDRIIVIHKDNGGVSSARNLGLNRMKGDYVTFLDSDDWLHETCLQTCLEESMKDYLDVLQFSWAVVKIDGTSIVHKRNDTLVCDSRQFAESGELSVSVCGGFYRACIINDNRIRFNEEMAYAEDQLFVLMCLYSSKRIKAIHHSLYYYFENPSSATRNSNTDKLVMSCLTFAHFKTAVGYYSSYVDTHNMYIFTDIVAEQKLPPRAIKDFYNLLNIKFNNISNKRHRLFIALSWFSFDFACYFIRFYRKHILKLV